MGDHLRHGEDPIRIGPLGQDGALLQGVIRSERYGILRNDVHAESGEQLRKAVVDQRIAVVRTTGDDHGEAAFLPGLLHQNVGLLLQFLPHLPLRFESPLHGLIDAFFPDPEPPSERDGSAFSAAPYP